MKKLTQCKQRESVSVRQRHRTLRSSLGSIRRDLRGVRETIRIIWRPVSHSKDMREFMHKHRAPGALVAIQLRAGARLHARKGLEISGAAGERLWADHDVVAYCEAAVGLLLVSIVIEITGGGPCGVDEVLVGIEAGASEGWLSL